MRLLKESVGPFKVYFGIFLYLTLIIMGFALIFIDVPIWISLSIFIPFAIFVMLYSIYLRMLWKYRDALKEFIINSNKFNDKESKTYCISELLKTQIKYLDKLQNHVNKIEKKIQKTYNPFLLKLYLNLNKTYEKCIIQIEVYRYYLNHFNRETKQNRFVEKAYEPRFIYASLIPLLNYPYIEDLKLNDFPFIYDAPIKKLKEVEPVDFQCHKN